MLKLTIKKSFDEFEFNFQCNFDKVISAFVGISTVLEFIQHLSM